MAGSDDGDSNFGSLIAISDNFKNQRGCNCERYFIGVRNSGFAIFAYGGYVFFVDLSPINKKLRFNIFGNTIA